MEAPQTTESLTWPGIKPPTWPELRAQALALIEVMNATHEQWTDYNLHDPGITIMETLCYALSDLGYRLDFPIEDLLALNPSARKPPIRMFYTATETLPNAALTIDDYRRLLIDQVELNNAWLYPAAYPTEYDVFIDPGSSYTGQKHYMQHRILDFLNQHCNLCESFNSVTILNYSYIELKLELILNSDATPELVYMELKKKLILFFTVSVETYSFDEMRGEDLEESQYTPEAVASLLEGPLPVNGFVPQSELDRTAGESGNRESGPEFIFDADELQQSLESISGVMKAELVSWTAHEEELKTTRTKSEDHPNSYPSAHPLIITGAIPCFNEAELTAIQNSTLLPEKTIYAQPLNTKKTESNIEISYPQGKYRNPGEYSTIQNQLPPYYGVGDNEIIKSVPLERKEQARQLRAYLILFDQILCNSFAQLEHTPDLLAMIADYNNQDVAQSYFVQKLPDDAWRNDFPDMYKTMEGAIGSDVKDKVSFENARQKNRLLTYLLSLFYESYMPIEIFTYIESDVYGLKIGDEKTRWTRYLKAKQNYLNRIVELISDRSQKSTLEKIIALKLAINNNQVIIEELLPEDPNPIPENTIPFAIAPDNHQKPIPENPIPFAIASGNPQKPIPENPIPFAIAEVSRKLCRQFIVDVKLPAEFVTQKDKKHLNEYACKIVSANIPAHIYFTISPMETKK